LSSLTRNLRHEEHWPPPCDTDADRLITRHDAAGVRIIVPVLTADYPRRDAAALVERCDVLFPELGQQFRAR
jgi:hypothetical protein